MNHRGRVYLGYRRIGDRFANDENTIELPSYYKLDAGAVLDLTPNWRVQLHGDNLTDQVGLTEGNPRTDVGAGGIGNVYMARPLFGRSFLAAATFEY